jgi:hypothetical protein
MTPLTTVDITRLRIWKRRYTLESRGFTPTEACQLAFLGWFWHWRPGSEYR